MKNGVNVNTSGSGHKALRIRAGVLRDTYVHTLVMRALQIGRREGYTIGRREGYTIGCRKFEGERFSYYSQPSFQSELEKRWPIDFETVEHRNGDSLDCNPENLRPATRSENTKLMHQRRKKKCKPKSK